MAEIASKQPRSVYRNVNPSDLASYRMPAAAYVSILHRISGAIMFILLPFIIWMFDTSVTSEVSYSSFTSAFMAGIGFVPGWFIKLVVLVLMWAYLHHFIAGMRHLYMDVSHNATTKVKGRQLAIGTLVLSLALTVVLGAKLFGLY